MSVLWVFAVAGSILALAAARAYAVEHREGLRKSKLRAFGTPLLALGLIALAWFAPASDAPAGRADVARPQRPPPAPSAPPAPSPTAAVSAALEDLRTQLAARVAERDRLNTEIAGLAKRIGELTTKPAVPPDEDRRPRSEPTRSEPHVADAPRRPAAWPLYVAFAALVAACVLLLRGDLSTLWPRRRRAPVVSADGESPPTVARLASCVHAGSWAAGLEIAARIQIEQLTKLEVLDYLFLRALCNTMVACAPGQDPRPSQAVRAEKLAAASEDLGRLRELAPHMAEAMWLHGYVKAQTGAWQPALDLFRTARSSLDGLPFDHNESICLLHLAEESMTRADTDGAARLFDEVTALGTLANHIPIVVVTHRILTLRGDIKAGRISEAAEGIDRMRQVEGLDDDAQRAVAAACDVYQVALQYRAGKLAEALEANVALLARWQPDKLPAVDDQVADEFLHPAVDRAALRIPAELYRALYFLEAVLRLELAARLRCPLESETVGLIAVALLRALQFEPRQRDALGALAALYLAYSPERTDRALAWLDAAVMLGVRSRRARTLLADARRAETQRKELLALFRSSSTRFLSDPTLGSQVRCALIEELGRFDEFRPVVLDLQETGALTPVPSGEVTLNGVHERATFVAHVAAEFTRHTNGAAGAALIELERELGALAAQVDSSTRRIVTIEHAIMEQLGRIVLR